MTIESRGDADTDPIALHLHLPVVTAHKLDDLARRRGVPLGVLIDELATMALLEDDLARRLSAVADPASRPAPTETPEPPEPA